MDLSSLQGKHVKFVAMDRDTLLNMIEEGTYDPSTLYIAQTDDRDGTRLFPYLGKQELSNNSIQYKRFTIGKEKKICTIPGESPQKCFLWGTFKFLKAAPIVLLQMSLTLQVTRRYFSQVSAGNRVTLDFSDTTHFTDVGQPEIEVGAFLPNEFMYDSRVAYKDSLRFAGDGRSKFPTANTIHFPVSAAVTGTVGPGVMLQLRICIDKKFGTGSPDNVFPGTTAAISDTEQDVRYYLNDTIVYMGDFKVANPSE